MISSKVHKAQTAVVVALKELVASDKVVIESQSRLIEIQEERIKLEVTEVQRLRRRIEKLENPRVGVLHSETH